MEDGATKAAEGEAELQQNRQPKKKVHRNPKDSTTTQTTVSTAAVSTSFSIEVDTVTAVTKPPPPMPSIPGSPAVPRVRTAPTDPSTPRGGGGVQQQPPAMTVRTSGAASGSGKTPDFLSASAHVPRTRSGGAKSHFNRTIRTSLSASDRPARISSGGSSKSKGFGKRMPSITRGESPRRNGKE
mmetsp:Transcript_17274/g.28043  ORF Transcript_17274/g.28043 Transcript_17274/m.28043 type:complete len:184 (+) Transcript_17274:68-619(+)